MLIAHPNSPLEKARLQEPQPEPEVKKEEGFPPLEKSPNAITEDTGVPAAYGITKSLEEHRYTFGPLYTPGELDAHDEYATSDALQKAIWDYARKGDNTLRKQHNSDEHIGDVVEQVVWPYEATVKMAMPGREPRSVVLPAGTAYMGVIWSEAAWPLVKSGAISGYSLGGHAIRVSTDDSGLSRMRKDAEGQPH